MNADFIQQLSVMIIPMLFAITVHEVSHGYAAYMLGDNTAKNAGRLTLNPIAHIDPIGLLVLVVTRMFGWAKPVPINYSIVSRKKNGLIIVSAAGPVSNFVLAVLSLIILLIYMRLPLASTPVTTFIAKMLVFSVQINVILGTFNLLPILPMDGGRILFELLPRDKAYQYGKLEPYGMFIIFGLLLLESFGIIRILSPLFKFMINIFMSPVRGGLM